MFCSHDKKMKFKVALMHSYKVFFLNLITGWVVMLCLLFGYAYQSDVFVTTSFADIWSETALSTLSLGLPLFVSSTVAGVKFTSIFFGQE